MNRQKRPTAVAFAVNFNLEINISRRHGGPIDSVPLGKAEVRKYDLPNFYDLKFPPNLQST